MAPDDIKLPFEIKCGQIDNNAASGIMPRVEKLESEGRFKEAFKIIWCLHQKGIKPQGLFSRLYFYKAINYNFEFVSNLFYYFKKHKHIKKVDFYFIRGYILGNYKQSAFNLKKAKKIIRNLKRTSDQRLILFREQLKKWVEEASKKSPQITMGNKTITGSSLDFFNEDIGKLLTIVAPSKKDTLDFKVKIRNEEEFSIHEQNLRFTLSKTNPLIVKYEINLSPYLVLVKIGDTFTLKAVTNSSASKRYPAPVNIFESSSKSTLTFARKINGVAPNSSYYPKNIQQLYTAIASDIKAGRPFSTTMTMILWLDKPPAKNLYWSYGGGVYYFFKKHWTLEYEKDVDPKGGSGKPFKTLVFSKTIKPNRYWKSLGVTKPFKIYLMVRAYYWKDIELAYKDYAQNLFDQHDESVTLDDATTISIQGSRVIGLLGHRIEEGWQILSRHKQFPYTPPMRGTFMMSCTTGQYFQPYVMHRPNTYGLMFTQYKMYPGAFALRAMLEGMMRKGLSGPKLVKHVNKVYSTYQKRKRTVRLYLNQEETHFKKFDDPYLGDADNDGLENRIDPEPTTSNSYEYKDSSEFDNTFGQLKVQLSNGSILTIPVYEDFLQIPSLFISPKTKARK